MIELCFLLIIFRYQWTLFAIKYNANYVTFPKQNVMKIEECPNKKKKDWRVRDFTEHQQPRWS